MDRGEFDAERDRTRRQLADGYGTGAPRRHDPDGPASTTPKLIREIGEAVFGRHLQTDLADCLDVHRRTVNRWLRGQDEPRPGVWEDVTRLLDARIATQRALRVKLAKHPNNLSGNTR